MSELKYNIFENALDSIDHGIHHFFSSEKYPNYKGKNYKYSILHTIQGIELLMKEKLYRVNPSLIYANIDRPINDDSLTVNFKALPQRLLNCGVQLSDSWLKTIEEGRRVRNRIEHKDVSFTLRETQLLLGRIFKLIIEFARNELKVELKDHLQGDVYEELIRQINFFDEIIRHAEENAKEYATEIENTGVSVDIWACPKCQAKTIVVSTKKTKTILYSEECKMCKSKIYFVRCSYCGKLYLSTEKDSVFFFCDSTCRWGFEVAYGF